MPRRYLSEEDWEERMRWIYGPFWPGSDARDTRLRNELNGMNTCSREDCLTPYRAARVWGEDGKLHRPGRGRMYCSRECADADRFERELLRAISAPVGGEQRVRDFGRLPERVA
jgi:hypothetical protein